MTMALQLLLTSIAKAVLSLYKNDFKIKDDYVPVCCKRHTMLRDETKSATVKTKLKIPKVSVTDGNITFTCKNLCSNEKYGKIVHLIMKDNPRQFNDTPRNSKKCKKEYSARTSSERCNKREKIDYKLVDSRYRSSMICQHLDAWTTAKVIPSKRFL